MEGNELQAGCLNWPLQDKNGGEIFLMRTGCWVFSSENVGVVTTQISKAKSVQ